LDDLPASQPTRLRMSSRIVGMTLHTEGHTGGVAYACVNSRWLNTSNRVMPEASLNSDSPSRMTTSLCGPLAFTRIAATASASVGAMMAPNRAPCTHDHPRDWKPSTKSRKGGSAMVVSTTMTKASSSAWTQVLRNMKKSMRMAESTSSGGRKA